MFSRRLHFVFSVALAVLAGLAVCGICGCRLREPSGRTEVDDTEELASETRGNLSVRLLLHGKKGDLTVRRPFVVTLEAYADPDHNPRFAMDENAFVQNQLGKPVTLDERHVVDESGGILYCIDFQLDAQLADDDGVHNGMAVYAFPELSVQFSPIPKPGESQEGESVSIFLPSLPLSIAQVAEDEISSLRVEEGDLRKTPFSTLDPAARRRFWLLVSLGCLAFVALAAAWIWRAIRRRRMLASLPPPPVPPETKAREALKALLAENLVEKGDFNGFYTRISNILRVYIEEKFNITAPEQTTQEFLELLAHNPGCLATHHPLLKAFLQHCDMVKFANMTPLADEVAKTVKSCESFIEATSAPSV